MPKVEVVLPGGGKITTDVTGRAAFRAPDSPGRFHVEILGGSISASAQIIGARVPTSQAVPEPTHSRPGAITYPRILATQDRFTLEGSGFRSEPDANHIFLNGDRCFVLASSPASLVALPGTHAPVGEAMLRVEAGGVAAQFSVSVVFLQFTGPAGAVSAGAAGQLILHARGTTEPLLLEVRDASPDVIQLTKGSVQRLKTSGGEDNAVPVDVKFVSAGNYVVSARLVSTRAATVGSDAVRKHIAEFKER